MNRTTRHILQIVSFVLAGIFVATFVFVVRGSTSFVNPAENSHPRNDRSPAAPIEKASAKTTLPRLRSDSDLLAHLVKEETRYFGTADGDLAFNDMAPAPGAAAPEAAEDDGGTNSGADSTEVSDTNSQVDGVAESDVVKTDGEYIYHLTGNTVRIYKADGPDVTLVSEIDGRDTGDGITGGNIYEMYLASDRLVTLGSYYQTDTTQNGWKNEPEDLVAEPDMAIAYCYWIPGRSFLSYTVYDISNPEKPKKERSFTLEGSTLSTRMIGDKLYFVINKYISYQEGYQPADLLPAYKDSTVSDEIYTVPVDDIYYFDKEPAESYLIVGMMDVTSDDPVTFDSYLNSGGDIYMNKNNLYVVAPQYDNDGNSTVIYRFAVTEKGVSYAAKGEVDGQPINQYCMDEYEGIFRIATTEWGTGNRIVTFDMDLKQLGTTPALAYDESIQSVRFMGEIGYMVTYRQTDPLYSVDLSDPRNPVVLDELKIPGFSRYLHPVGEDLLIGFGRHTVEVTQDDWQGNPETVAIDKGMKVSLFDISDPKKLKEIDVLILEGGCWSEAFENPRALYCHPSEPLFGFYREQYDSVQQVFIDMVRVENRRLVVAASLSQNTSQNQSGWEREESDDMTDNGWKGEWFDVYGARLVSIGKNLYGVSYRGVTVYDIDTFQEIGNCAA